MFFLFCFLFFSLCSCCWGYFPSSKDPVHSSQCKACLCCHCRDTHLGPAWSESRTLCKDRPVKPTGFNSHVELPCKYSWTYRNTSSCWAGLCRLPPCPGQLGGLCFACPIPAAQFSGRLCQPVGCRPWPDNAGSVLSVLLLLFCISAFWPTESSLLKKEYFCPHWY